jgi:hypothetical protein
MIVEVVVPESLVSVPVNHCRSCFRFSSLIVRTTEPSCNVLPYFIMTSVEKKRRWTTKDRDAIVTLIKRRKIDPEIATKEYIHRIQDDYRDSFGFCKPEIFVKHYIKTINNYRLAQQLDSRSMFI